MDALKKAQYENFAMPVRKAVVAIGTAVALMPRAIVSNRCVDYLTFHYESDRDSFVIDVCEPGFSTRVNVGDSDTVIDYDMVYSWEGKRELGSDQVSPIRNGEGEKIAIGLIEKAIKFLEGLRPFDKLRQPVEYLHNVIEAINYELTREINR